MLAATGSEKAADSGGPGLDPPRSPDAPSGLLTVIVCYCLTSTVVLAGGAVGLRYLAPSGVRGHVFDEGAGAYANWDGQWYEVVASEGYSYRDGDYSSVNFFPAYPLLARGLARSTGMGYDLALVTLSNTFLLLTFLAISRYVEAYSRTEPDYRLWVLLSMGLCRRRFSSAWPIPSRSCCS